MGNHKLLPAVVGFLAVCAPAFGQSYPAEAIILQNEVEVRSGPSKTFFPTSKLNKNDKVVVLRESKEAQGWLEIQPPKGSFSWINAKNVKQVDARHAVVDCDPARPVAVLPGSTLVNQPPNRESMKLTAGTIVVIVDRPLSVNGESWLPIQPHPQEVRYIPSESVKATTVVATTNTTPNWNRTPDGFATNSVLADAEQALKANDVNRARYLYQQVANNSTDQNQKVLALNKLASLPQGPGTTGQLTANPKTDETRTAFSPTPINLQQLQPAAWSTYGRLRDTKMTREDGQPIYSLEDSNGKVMTYITTNPGKSLQSYIGRTVAVFGPTMYRPDSAARLQYVVASHVAVP
jgi:uncharacterized protein YgiM (DUF1202 family)